MKTHYGNKTIYLFIFILIGSIILALIFENQNRGINFHNSYKIEEGVLDLTDFQYNELNIIGIEGDAEFYWNQLLSPSDFENNSGGSRETFFDE